MDRSSFCSWLASCDLAHDDHTLNSFERFQAALYERNEVVNLTRVPKDQCMVRHFVDSLLFASLFSSGARVLDIGCGAGFPAWPLALARPDLQIMALDSAGKPLAFLREHPLPNLEVVQGRAEDWGVRDRFDVVTGRALAPLAIQLELSAAPCKIGGIVAPMRTENDLANLESFPLDKLGLSLETIHRLPLPETGELRVIPWLRKTKSTLCEFPRSWATMKTKPLG